MVLISAPAGSGKTMLLSEWIANSNLACAWLSLDRADNDPQRFLSYLVAALQTIESGIGADVLDDMRAPGVAPGSRPVQIDSALAILINDVADLANNILLVLDDYHLIHAEPVHDALNYLIENMPSQMHLVIATREDPHLPLSRLRGRGQLTELRARELRFTSSEAGEFLKKLCKENGLYITQMGDQNGNYNFAASIEISRT